MSISNASSHTLTVFMTLAMLAGCSAGSSQITATRGGQIPDAATQSVQHLLPGSRISRIQAMLRGAVARHLVTTPSFMDPESVTKPLVFLLDYASGTVNVYLQKDKNKMVGQIASPGGSGIATDSSRNFVRRKLHCIVRRQHPRLRATIYGVPDVDPRRYRILPVCRGHLARRCRWRAELL